MEQAQITVLEYPDNIRLRKEMYLIDPNHCLYEIVDNAVDEYSAGRCKNIKVCVFSPREGAFPQISVSDDGAGIPTTLSTDPKYKGKTQVFLALGTVHAGGKFGADGSYKTTTSGLHGVGASCVNAVSEYFYAEVVHDKTITTLDFRKGILKDEKDNFPYGGIKEHGTKILFQLDRELWKSESFDFDAIKRRLKQLSYLNPGLKITYQNGDEKIEFYHENGLIEYFQDIISTKTMLDSTPISIIKTIQDKEIGAISISIVLGYSSGYTSEVYGFVNNVNTKSGDHIIGFNAGISKAITGYYSSNEKYKSLVKSLTSDDTKEGLVAIISVKVMSPKFEGQSKASIKMPEVRTAVNAVVADELKLYLEQHPSFSKLLGDKLDKAIKARIASKRAREAIRNAKNSLESSMPNKLMACSSKKPEECEIFLVEGELPNCPR